MGNEAAYQIESYWRYVGHGRPVEFTEIITEKRNNFILNCTDGSCDITLKNIYVEKDDHGSRNPNLYYDGGGGTNSLDYAGNNIGNVKVSLTDRVENGKQYYLRFEGGHNKKNEVNGENNVTNSLDVYTKEDLDIAKLTHKNDKVDLDGLQVDLGTKFYAEGGDDRMYGSQFGDYFDGGSGKDIIHTGDGNDVIATGYGADIASAGAGEDVIYASVNITNTDDKWVFGDYELIANGDENDYRDYRQVAGEYNDADLFFINVTTSKSETTAIAMPSGDSLDALLTSAGIEAGGDLGSKLAMAALKGAGYTAGGAIVSSGITFGASLLGYAIGSGAASNPFLEYDTITDANSSEINIGDWDPWADTIVVSLGEDIEEFEASRDLKFSDGTSLKLEGKDFLTLHLADDFSIDENTPTGATVTSNGHNSLAESAVMNSLRVWYDYSDDPATPHELVLRAETLNGTDYLADYEEGSEERAAMVANLEGYLEGEEVVGNGVWIIGDYGNSVIYGDGLQYVAGTNSGNTIFAGSYVDASVDADTINQNISAAFAHATGVIVYAGGGNDDVYGSVTNNDFIYGGDHDDVIHHGGGQFNTYYGGNGTDVVSFAAIYDQNDNVLNYNYAGIDEADGLQASEISSSRMGIDVDLRDQNGGADGDVIWTVETASIDGQGNTVLTTSNFTIASINSVEGIIGTEFSDKMSGNYQANSFVGLDGDDRVWGFDGADFINGGAGNDRLYGGGHADTILGGTGNDIIEGGKGNDVMTGGGGADTFIFHASQGADVITDFEAGDSLRVFDLTEAQMTALSSSIQAGQGMLSTGGGSSIDISTSNVALLQSSFWEGADGLYDGNIWI